MNTALLILIMIVVGALIGGVTNSLAIKMLFRPFNTKYIGKMKVPFTPGLIPKRRNELADQLGKLVVEHLLTPEGLQKKLQAESFQKQMVEWAQQETESLLLSDRTVREWLHELEIPLDEETILNKVHASTKEHYQRVMDDYRHKTIRSVIGPSWDKKGKDSLQQGSAYILSQLENYISSEEGKRKLGQIIEDYLETQGFLGNMISSFLGNEGLADKIRPAIVQYLRSDDAENWLTNLLEAEWEKWVEKPVHFYEEKLGAEVAAEGIATAITTSLPIKAWLDRSIHDHTHTIRTHIVEQIVPTFVQKSVNFLVSRTPEMMGKLHLSEIVKEQVESFSVSRLEKMVLDISRREFKMITYLGALLGGVIGFVQAFFILVLGS